MTRLDGKPHDATVLFCAGSDAWCDRAKAALEFADAERDRLVSERADLSAAPVDGIFCERRDARETWRYEVIRGFALWVLGGAALRNHWEEGDEKVALRRPQQPISPSSDCLAGSPTG